jgi:oligopeptide/dipeptide ABC transporter ATP-binding protein
MKLLELDRVSKTFWVGNRFWGKPKVVEAVKEVSLRLDEGCSLGLVGESGCGKSTLGRMVLGLEKPDHGEVFVFGKSLYRLGVKELRALRRNMHVVFQDSLSAVNPRLTVGQIIAEPLHNYLQLTYAQERNRVRALLETVRLFPADIDKYPHQLSGGQLQRVTIARAIALQPKLMVLDEPVSSLDISIQAQILHLLSELKKELRLSYLFISHDIAVIKALADHLAVMYRGRIVEWLDDSSAIQVAQHPYSQKLLRSVLMAHPRYRRKLQADFDELSTQNEHRGGCVYLPRCAKREEICWTKEPALEPCQKQHRVACFMVQDGS